MDLLTFFFQWHYTAHRISVPWGGLEPRPWQQNHQVLATGPPRNSLPSDFQWSGRLCLYIPGIHPSHYPAPVKTNKVQFLDRSTKSCTFSEPGLDSCVPGLSFLLPSQRAYWEPTVSTESMGSARTDTPRVVFSVQCVRKAVESQQCFKFMNEK